MRKIICRFANQTDLDAFNKQNGLSLTKDVKEYDFRTNTAIYKRTGKLKGFDTSSSEPFHSPHIRPQF